MRKGFPSSGSSFFFHSVGQQSSDIAAHGRDDSEVTSQLCLSTIRDNCDTADNHIIGSSRALFPRPASETLHLADSAEIRIGQPIL